MLAQLVALSVFAMLAPIGEISNGWSLRLLLLLALFPMMPQVSIDPSSFSGIILYGSMAGLLVTVPLVIVVEGAIMLVDLADRVRGYNPFGQGDGFSDLIGSAVRWAMISVIIMDRGLITIPALLSHYVVELSGVTSYNLELWIGLMEGFRVYLKSLWQAFYFVLVPIVISDLVVVLIFRFIPSLFQQGEVFLLRSSLIYLWVYTELQGKGGAFELIYNLSQRELTL